MPTAEIYIDSLKIKDFGPFYGSHCLDLTAADDRRAILIGGKNGAGKTHLLRALYLATVGESGAGDLKKIESGSDSTKFDLKESLNRRAKSEGNTTSEFEIKLSQRDVTGSIGRRLTLFRQIRHRPNSPPVFSAKAYLANDDRWIEDDLQVQKLREAFLPRHLSRFFFFDAERNQNLQLNERDIIEGISRVLGLHAYTELENDLYQLIKFKIPQRFGSGSEVERNLNRVLSDIQRNEADLKTYLSDIEDKKHSIQDIDDELADIYDSLQTIGAVDPDEIACLNKQRDDIKETKGKLEANLTLAWEGALPVALLGDFRYQLYAALEKEERRRDWENRKSSVEPKIPKIKKEVFDDPPPEHILPSFTVEFYKNRLDEALKGLFHPPEEGLADSIFIVPERNEVSARIRNQLIEKPAAIGNLEVLATELDKKTAELREMDQRLKQLNQDPSALQKGNELRERRGALAMQKENFENELQNLEEKIKLLKTELQESKRRATNLTEEVNKVRQGKDLSSLAHGYRDAVSEIKNRAAIRLREKISRIVGELWLDITDRGLEYRSLVFDKKWDCELIKPDGSKIPWDSANTSAGQRQVRILAFTEALRRLARFVPPLVVDTPLGRLDREVKESVLERLYLTGHQSIILTTNSEIAPNGRLFENISPLISKVYTLNPEGDQDSQSYHVKISNDYFKRVL